MSFFNRLIHAFTGESSERPPNASPHGSNPDEFKQVYHCFPVAVCDKYYLEEGDKILLPPSAFEELVNKTISYPMMFRLNNPKNNKRLHCGVMEFSAGTLLFTRLYDVCHLVQCFIGTHSTFSDSLPTRHRRGLRLHPVLDDGTTRNRGWC